MKIIKPNLKWKELPQPNDPAKIDSIGIHHIEATTATPEDIHRWHLNRGWRGAGYGYYVRKDGSVYEMRGLGLNAAVDKENGHIVSIAFEGHYQKIDKTMPDAQFNAGVDLIEWLRPQLPNLKKIDGHNHWNQTACPGQYFPLTEMKLGKKRGALTWEDIIMKVTTHPDAWVKAVNTSVAIAKAEGSLGDLETLQWLPALIEKIYYSK